MAGLTNAYEIVLLRAMFGDGRLPSFPSTWYVALFSVMPADNGVGGTEIAGAGYARKAYGNASVNWQITTAPISNLQVVQFNQATANYPAAVVGYGLYTAAVGGSLVYTALLQSPASFLSGETPSFGIGDIVIDAD